jgi:hypothetical protein
MIPKNFERKVETSLCSFCLSHFARITGKAPGEELIESKAE